MKKGVRKLPAKKSLRVQKTSRRTVMYSEKPDKAAKSLNRHSASVSAQQMSGRYRRYGGNGPIEASVLKCGHSTPPGFELRA